MAPVIFELSQPMMLFNNRWLLFVSIDPLKGQIRNLLSFASRGQNEAVATSRQREIIEENTFPLLLQVHHHALDQSTTREGEYGGHGEGE
jgi:hypothetical protein